MSWWKTYSAVISLARLAGKISLSASFSNSTLPLFGVDQDGVRRGEPELVLLGLRLLLRLRGLAAGFSGFFCASAGEAASAQNMAAAAATDRNRKNRSAKNRLAMATLCDGRTHDARALSLEQQRFGGDLRLSKGRGRS